MDHRHFLYFKGLLDTLQAKIDDILTRITSSGQVSTNLDSLQAQADLMLRPLLNRPFAAAGLAEGTDANTIKTTNAIEYLNGGLFKSKSGTDNIAIPAGTAINSGGDTAEKCKFLVSLQADGTVVVTQGAIVAAGGTALLPAVPANETPIGYFEIETDASTTYTPGTTDNGAGGITDTYVDLAWPDSGTDAISAVGSLTHPSDADVGDLPQI